MHFSLLLIAVLTDDPKVWWWEGTVAARKIGIAAIGVFGSSMGEMQVHGTAWLIVIVMLLTAIVQPFGKQKLLQFLELGTLCATWMTLWAGSVFNSYPRCENEKGGTVGWCDTLSVMVGLIDIAMVFVAVGVVVYLTKQKQCDACCGRVKDETVGRRSRESIAREAKKRRSRMESADVTSFGNPSWGAKKVADEGEMSIEMTTNTNTNASGEQKVSGSMEGTDSIISFTNPRLDATTIRNTQELSIDMPAPRPTILDSPLPNGSLPHHHTRDSTKLPPDWNKYNNEEGRRYYSNKNTQESSWVAPEGSTGGSASTSGESVSAYSNPMKKTKAKKSATAGALTKKHHTRDSTKLPPDWNKYNNEEGRRYYSNNNTQESSWVAPEGSMGGSAAK
jgi:hypothetical protein